MYNITLVKIIHRIGEFEFSIELAPESKYCVTVVFVDHPYCDRQVRIDKSPETPTACSALIKEPVSTFNCTIKPPEEFIILSNYRLHIIIICGLFIIILVLIGFQIWLWKKKEMSDNNDDFNKISDINCEDSRWQRNFTKKIPVFFLHFLTNEDQEDVCCKYLREWMQSVVEVVMKSGTYLKT